MITNEIACKSVEEVMRRLADERDPDFDWICERLDLYVWERIPDIVHAAQIADMVIERPHYVYNANRDLVWDLLDMQRYLKSQGR